MIIHLPYLLFVVLMAYRDSENLTNIRHWLNGLFHCVAAGLMTYFFSWQDGLTLLLLTKTVFDTSFSLFRGLNPFYSSPDKKKAWTDRLEQKVFGNPVIARIVYIVAVIILQLTK